MAQGGETGAKDYTNAILWQQYSGEYRALCFQAYNFARLSINECLNAPKMGKVNCVVVDIDESEVGEEKLNITI